ncbi:Ig-like domain-containing protein, partial [Rhizobium johnstonii]|uniref:Ig-like domain-containing protein n=1 Tax=Rhizobium johnstonii TaxID=3019933 RepID=UPI003F9AAA89
MPGWSGARKRTSLPDTKTRPDPGGVVSAGSNPKKGAVTATGTDWMEYRAGEYSSGTDSFEYTVIDTLGGRA